eukprot:scaffold3.g6733.t1
MRSALVSRAWRDAHRTPGRHWASICLDGSRLVDEQQNVAYWKGVLGSWIPCRAAGIRHLELRNFRVFGPGPRQQLMCLLVLTSGARLERLVVARSAASLVTPAAIAIAGRHRLRTISVHLPGFCPMSFLGDLGTPALAEGLEELEVILVRTRDGTSTFDGPFPTGLTALRRLRRLRLEAPYAGGANTVWTTLPYNISEWQQMEALTLVDLGLARLPRAIGALPVLRELVLARNVLGMGDQLGGPAMPALPAELSCLSTLTKLDISYNLFEAGLPPVVGHLTALEELNVSGNLFGTVAAELPPTFRQLTRLRALSLTNCRLARLPEAVRACSTLRLLKLNINTLTDLPSGPYMSPNLESIDLAHNRLAAFPAALCDGQCCPNLVALSWVRDGVHYTNPQAAMRAAAGAPPPGGALVMVAAPALAPAIGAAVPAPAEGAEEEAAE